MYKRNEGKALAIPLAEFGNNNCSAWSSALKHDIVTAAKCAKGYHFMQTCLPKYLNSEGFEGYTFNALKFGPNLFEFLLFKVIPLQLFYYQTIFETWHNQHSWYEHKKNAIKRWGHRACLRVSRLLNWGIFTGCTFKIRIHFLQNEVVVTWNTQNFILNIKLLLFK